MRSSVGSSRAPYRDAVIDFGSFKETIEIDPSDYGGGQNYYAGCSIRRKSMDSDHSGSIQAYDQDCYSNPKFHNNLGNSQVSQSSGYGRFF